MSIGMVLARDAEEVANEPFYSYIQAGVEQVLAAHDYSLTMSRPGGAPGADLEVYQRWALEQRVDGVILFDMVVDDPRIDLLIKLNLSAVEVTSDATSQVLPRIVVDDNADARTLVQHLADQGYRGIIHLSGPTRLVHERLRRAAIARACKEFGLPLTQRSCEYTLDDGRAGLGHAIAGSTQLPVGVIGSSDLLAVGASAMAHEMSLDVPEQVGVTSWDESLLCRVAAPTLTCLNRNPIAMGSLAAELLLSRLSGSTQESVRMPPSQLVIRVSSDRESALRDS
jgi:DNA-binding LacI/PurR family transcriptional regulator